MGCILHERTCKLERHLCRKNKSTIELKHSYMYDFGPRRCNQAVPASSNNPGVLLHTIFMAFFLTLQATLIWCMQLSMCMHGFVHNPPPCAQKLLCRNRISSNFTVWGSTKIYLGCITADIVTSRYIWCLCCKRVSLNPRPAGGPKDPPVVFRK